MPIAGGWVELDDAVHPSPGDPLFLCSERLLQPRLRLAQAHLLPLCLQALSSWSLSLDWEPGVLLMTAPLCL